MMTWIGIDVAKKNLVVCLLKLGCKPKHKTFGNTPQGRTQLLEWVLMHSQGDTCHFCLESTGSYSFGIAQLLARSGMLVSVENPRPIKHFAIAYKLKCKTDKVDAHVIAQYARLMNPRPWHLTDPKRQEICQLRRRIGQIQKMRAMEANRLEDEFLPPTILEQIQTNIASFDLQIKDIHIQIGQLLQECEPVQVVYEAITKICGIGPVCGLQFASEIDVDQFEEPHLVASFLGLSPRICESGEFRGKTKITKQGDKQMRAAFYSAAKTARRFNPVLKEFYEMLTQRGLSKKQATVAVARKLVTYCCAIAQRVLQLKKITYPGGECKSRNPWPNPRKFASTA